MGRVVLGKDPRVSLDKGGVGGGGALDALGSGLQPPPTVP